MKKTVLITGAAGGIGKALCREFAAAGYNIALHCFSSAGEGELLAESLEKQYGISAKAFKADLSDKKQAVLLAKSAAEFFGSVDILINNAGVAYQELFQCTDDEKVRALFEINLMSAMSLAKELLPYMIRARWGRIINISSMWGISGASCEVHYSASKSALIGFTKALAKETGPSGITVNCIAPGFIDTKMNANLDPDSVREIVEATPVSRAGTPEDISPLALFLCTDGASFITGQTIAVDGGYLG